jgi:hypothetical protein
VARIQVASFDLIFTECRKTCDFDPDNISKRRYGFQGVTRTLDRGFSHRPNNYSLGFEDTLVNA